MKKIGPASVCNSFLLGCFSVSCGFFSTAIFGSGNADPPAVSADTKQQSVAVGKEAISAGDAKDVARRAYEIVRSLDIQNKDFCDTKQKLEQFQDNSKLTDEQKEIGRTLLNIMNKMSAMQGRAHPEDSQSKEKLEWKTTETGGKSIKELRSSIATRKGHVKNWAKAIATEYLSIGDLSDKLQMTTQDFQKAMGEKEQLYLAIKSLNSPVIVELDRDAENCINEIFDSIYPMAPDSNQSKSANPPLARDITEQMNEIIRGCEPGPAAYVAWTKRIFDLGITYDNLVAKSKLVAKPKGIASSDSVLDDSSSDKFHQILALVDAVPAFKHWTAEPELMRVHRVSARLLFWKRYSERVTQGVLQPSMNDITPPLLPTEDGSGQPYLDTTNLQLAANIYQQIRISSWPLLGGSEGKPISDDALTPRVTYQVPLPTNDKKAKYTVQNPKPSDWIRFTIPPGPGTASSSEALMTFAGIPLSNTNGKTWKVLEFHFDGKNWSQQDGLSLKLGDSYRLSAGCKYYAPKPPGDAKDAKLNFFSVAIPPNINGDNAVTMVKKRGDRELLENPLGYWKVIRFIWKQGMWNPYEGNEARLFLEPYRTTPTKTGESQ